MKPTTDVDTIRSVRFFRGLDETELREVVQVAQRNDHAHDSFLFYQGDAATRFYIILQGRIRLIQLTYEGHQVILGFVGPREGVGIIAAFDQADYPVSAQAVHACVTLSWDRATLNVLMERYPIIALHTLHMVANRFVELQNQYRELATERVERRVARALLRLIAQAGQHIDGGVLIDFPLSRQDLADMTGTTIYTVSRIFSSWEQQGLIESGRERVVIRQADRLTNIAEDIPDPPSDSPPQSCLNSLR